MPRQMALCTCGSSDQTDNWPLHGLSYLCRSPAIGPEAMEDREGGTNSLSIPFSISSEIRGWISYLESELTALLR